MSFLDKTFAVWIIIANVTVGFSIKEDLQKRFTLKTLTNTLFTVLLFMISLVAYSSVSENTCCLQLLTVLFQRNTFFLKAMKIHCVSCMIYLLFFLTQYSQRSLVSYRTFALLVCHNFSKLFSQKFAFNIFIKEFKLMLMILTSRIIEL